MSTVITRQIHAGRIALAPVLGLALWSCSSCSSSGASADSRPSEAGGAADVRFVFADLDPSRCVGAKPAPAATYEPPLQVSRGVKWQARLAPGSTPLSPPVTWPDGASVVASMWGGIQGVSKDGAVLWTLPPPSGLPDRDQFAGYRSVGARDLVLFGDGFFMEDSGSYGKVHGLSRDGKQRWTASLDGPFDYRVINQIVVGPFVASDGRILIAGGDSKLYFLDAGTGAIKKRITTPDPITHLVIDESGTSYAVVNHKVGRVAAVSKDGALLWAQQLGPVPTSTKSTAFAQVSGLALSPTGDLIVSATAYGDGNARTWVMAVDRGCGKMRWKLELQGSGGAVVVGVDGNILGCLAEGTSQIRTLLSISSKGELRWKKYLETISKDSQFRSIGPLGADGTLYAFVDAYDPVKKAHVVLLHAYSQSGERLWEELMPVTNFDGSDATLRRDGALIFPGEIKDGEHGSIYLIGYQTQSPGLARSGWPRFYHDNLSTSDYSTPLE